MRGPGLKRALFALLGALCLAVSAAGRQAGTASVRAEALPPSPEPAAARLSLRAPRKPVPLTETPTVTIRVQGFALGKPTPGEPPAGLAHDPRGQHVALLVDDEPYRPLYGVDEPISLGKLNPGTHLVRAVLVRSWGESLKSSRAMARAELSVRTKRFRTVRGGALLTLIQPRDVVADGTDEVLLDLRLDRYRLGLGSGSLRLILDGQEFHLGHAGAYRLRGLRPGPHTLTLDTLDRFGDPVLRRFAGIERRFTVGPAPDPETPGAAETVSETE